MDKFDLHPMIVHFPIALTLVALLADLLSYRFKSENCRCWLSRTAVGLSVLATLGAISAATTGAYFTMPASGLAAVVKNEHANFAAATTTALVLASLVGVIAMFRYKYAETRLRYVFTALMIIAAVLVALTGWKGGTIVYHIWLHP